MTTVLRFALLASLLTVAACSRSGTTAAPPTASMTVTVAEAARRSVQREVVASGSVAAWQEMSLGVELSGLRIADVRVEPGAQVVAGQALLELDRRTLDIQARQAEASLAQARAALEHFFVDAELDAVAVCRGALQDALPVLAAPPIFLLKASFFGTAFALPVGHVLVGVRGPIHLRPFNAHGQR
jgi:multidrug efflux pump subunit AcrA (membrane-fusion protein)